ncbi:MULTISPECIES: phage tailspike protein [Serratia]|uniref:phage tailspike protein n=1 Tax=Serratia TaxID=613 RepID=UPI0011B999BA|nr:MULTISPECIES: phage tailspike protein [Serratia]TWY28365.1 hypothetical protein FR965_16925 [Serratia marcescens]
MDRRSVVKGLVSFFFGGALTSPAWAKDNGLLLPNIASLSVIPPRLLTLVSSFKGSANGQMYIGRADTDPLVSANQIPVYLEREDGSRMLVSQPILLDESSAPRINSEGGRLVTLESYALAVHDREGGSSFIFPMSVNMSLILLTYILMGSCQSYLPLLGPILLGIKMSP